jgi:hypothetical protein
MVTWLPRSLVFIVSGAVLAYAVTARVDEIDLQTTGVILLLVGIFDLLLNIGLTLYLRQADERRVSHSAYIPDRRAPGRPDDSGADGDRYATRQLPRDPDWH